MAHERAHTFNEDDGSPSKRKKLNEIGTFTMAGDGDKLYVRLVDPGFELILVEEKVDKDGFMDPVRKMIKRDDEQVCSYSFITIAACKSHPLSSNAAMNPPNKHGQTYPRQYIIRAVTQSTHQTRKQCVSFLAYILNKHNRENPPSLDNEKSYRIWQQTKDKDCYKIPEDFDRTSTGEKLDSIGDHLLPSNIISLIRKCYENVESNWAIDNPRLADKFFSHPYPEQACVLLGYPRDRPLIQPKSDSAQV